MTRAHSMKSHFIVEIKFDGKAVLEITNTHSLESFPPNCVNNVAPLITLARRKMGLVLMLGHTA